MHQRINFNYDNVLGKYVRIVQPFCKCTNCMLGRWDKISCTLSKNAELVTNLNEVNKAPVNPRVNFWYVVHNI